MRGFQFLGRLFQSFVQGLKAPQQVRNGRELDIPGDAGWNTNEQELLGLLTRASIPNASVQTTNNGQVKMNIPFSSLISYLVVLDFHFPLIGAIL
jgi:hypothetical protein